MAEQITPTEVQRRVFRLLNYEDGLWDITLGVMFLLLGIYPVTRRLLGPALNALLFLALLAILVAGQLYARRVVSAPRIGMAKPRRSPAKTALLAIAVVLVLATFGLVLATLLSPQSIPEPRWTHLPEWVGDLDVDILASLAIIGLFSLMAYLSGVLRLYLYGWLIGLGNLASTALTLYAGYAFNLPLVIAAGIILLIGLSLLIRFLKKYPIPTAEV
jgi:hypothetical protein